MLETALGTKATKPSIENLTDNIEISYTDPQKDLLDEIRKKAGFAAIEDDESVQ